LPEKFSLDTYLAVDTEYQTDSRTYLLIQALGTDSDTDGYLEINGVDTGIIKELLAPLHKTGANMLGPLHLKDLFYVVLPNTKFFWRGASGSKCRIKGVMVRLAVGEAVPEDYRARADRQGLEYYTYFERIIDASAEAKTLPARQDTLIGEIQPKTIEELFFNHVAMAEVVGVTVSEGQVGIRFELEGRDLEWLLEKPKHGGIDILSMPRPPATGSMQAFTLEAYPVKVPGDYTLKLYARNNTDTDITIPLATGNGLFLTLIARYRKTG